MNGRWSPPRLEVQFPPLPAAGYYQLLHVGLVRRRLANSLESEALAYFQVGPGPDSPVVASDWVVKPVSMQSAALLIPGSRWSASGQLLSAGSHAYPERRTVLLGSRAPRPRRLRQLLPAGAVLPPALHAELRNVWYVLLEADTERRLIPCFELLRAFYYQAGGKLVDYFFSRLPLEAICWPVMAPNPTTNFTAHFCVAAQLDRPHEARVLAELLFNPAYRATIQRAHADLAMAWHAHATRRMGTEGHLKTSFRLGRAVSVTAHGTAFTVGNQAFFWVSCLVPPRDWFSFRSVVYHPLQRFPAENSCLFPPLPAFTDVLSHR